jgi:hypothetical protein
MRGRVFASIITAVIFFSGALWSALVAADCLQYGIVRLTGRLVQQTYPGPPDYESIRKGDEPLIIWILQLNRSVCVASSGSGYPGSYGTREIQLVLDGDEYAKGDEYARYRQLLGKKITVTGSLVPGGAKYQKRFVIVRSEVQSAGASRIRR